MPDNISLPFSRQEYHQRLAKTRGAMEAAGIDVLFAADPSNLGWLTGYNAWSFYTPQGVIVSLDDDPIYWGRNQDSFAAHRTCWMDEDHIVPYPETAVMTDDDHPMRHLAAYLRSRGWDTKRLAVEADNYYYSAFADRQLKEALGRDDLLDGTLLMNWQRGVKSDQELDYMRTAGRILEQVYQRVREVVTPGMRKNDLVAEIMHAGVTGTPEHGGDYPAIVPILPTGADASASHMTWTDAPLEPGKGTFLELAGCYNRYHAPLCRSMYIGEPPDHFRTAEKAVIEGLNAGIEVARAGNTAGDIAVALRDALAAYGIDRGEARCGYPIGLSYPPDWGERTISFRPSDNTVLQPGMTFHFMPGLWMDDWGLEITESIVITESGPAECLLDVPRELMVFA